MTEGGQEAGLDLIVIGAGPTGLATGAAARRAGLAFLVIERGSICDAIRQYPTDLLFFTSRERLEIAHVPFAIPDAKPSRAQALAYYREVARQYELPVANYEEVLDVARADDGRFHVRSRSRLGETTRVALAVVLATGYFGRPRRLGVPGEDRAWVDERFREPYGHFGDKVVVVGGGNSAIEAALDLYRWGAEVTLVHRGTAVKRGVKYWLKPDIDNRVAEGTVRAMFSTRVTRFEDAGVRVVGPKGESVVAADAAYVLIGYEPELTLAARVGVELCPETSRPVIDPETCESNVAGFYIAGTIQAGHFTDQIFIENSRDHGPRIVDHVRRHRSTLGTLPAIGAGPERPG